MAAVAKEALDFIKIGLKDNAFYRSLAYGMAFSLVMTLLIGTFYGTFTFSSDAPWLHVVTSQQYWVGIFFVSFSFVFAFAGYLSEVRLREDILTPLRKKLVGTWAVRAQTWKIEDGKIELGHVDQICEIGIDSFGRKLFLHFRIKNSDIFRDDNIDITNLNIQYQTEPMKLIYFYDTQLQLKKPVYDGAISLDKISFPIVTVLDFKIENEQVNTMTGYWYDINNSLFSLAHKMKDLRGLQELTEAVSRGAITFKGDIEFSRWSAPKRAD